MAPEKRAGKLVQRLEARAFESCEGMQDLETPSGVENLLDYSRTRFEPIEVFSGRLVDDIDLRFRASARGGNQEVRATRRRAPGDSWSWCFARGSSLASKTVRSVLCPRMKRYEGEHVLEANDASDDELEAEYQEAVALMTIAKQRRAEVDRARQFLSENPQSSEDRKAELDKLKQKLPCGRCRQLGH